MKRAQHYRPAVWLTAAATVAAIGATLVVAAPGGAASAEKEYTTNFEAECVLAPGTLNRKGTIKVSGRAKGPETVEHGQQFKLAGATITVTTPASWGETLYTLGAREANGAVTSTIVDASGAEPARLNIAKPPEFKTGLPFETPVENREVVFTVPSLGRTFALGPYTATGKPGEKVKLTIDTAPGFKETSLGHYESTGEGIQSETSGYTETGEKVIGPVPVSCDAPEGVAEGEIPIVEATSTSTSTASTTSSSSTTTSSTTTTTSSTTTTTSSTTTTTTTSSSTTSTGVAPVVSRIEPNSGPVQGGTPVRIVGTHLSAQETRCTSVNIAECHVSVHFGAQEAKVTAASPTNVLVESPAVSAPATVDVTVTVNGVTSATKSADRFTYKEQLEALEEKLVEEEKALP